MRIEKTQRGFEVLLHETYPPNEGGTARLAQQSSLIGSYEDSWERPGSSSLWVGEHHHLSREEAREFAARLLAWAETGSLELPVRGRPAGGAE